MKKIDLLEYVTSRTPVEFLKRGIELLEAAYFDAYQSAERADLLDLEKQRMRAQSRQYLLNPAFRKAATEAGLRAEAPRTRHQGEQYSLVYADDIQFTRINARFNNSIPRPAKYRKDIARLNKRYEPRTADMFCDPEPPPTEGLGCLVLTIDPPHWESQSVPSGFVLGVPYSNLRGWHLYEPLTGVIAAYHQTKESKVEDLAFGRLKKQLKDAEEDT